MKYELMAWHPFTGERVTIVMSEFVHKAYQFAKKSHEGQKRKYSGEPYINHPVEVMQIVSTVPHTEEMLAAALLHDVVEDCGVQLLSLIHISEPTRLSLVSRMPSSA